jgi:AmmeMemoRadiSam system protein B
MSTSTLRVPAVAGRFYPRRPDELLREVRGFLGETDAIGSYKSGGQECPPHTSQRYIGCIAPHAGYMYSGHVAGAVYSQLEIPRQCVVLCPNHTGIGYPLAIMTRATWQTPLGEVAPGVELGEALLHGFRSLHEDSSAHLGEHAIEVQLPFLQTRQPELKLVPIAIGTRDFDLLSRLGEALARTVAAQPEPTLIVASSDMNHYEPDALTRIKDRKAIDRVLALDPRGLWEVVMNEDVSMCGFGPAVIMLTAAKRLGASSAALVKYATSGDISGDRDAVVGYAGIVVK